MVNTQRYPIALLMVKMGRERVWVLPVVVCVETQEDCPAKLAVNIK